MDSSVFISLAYIATGGLLAALLIASLIRARTVKRQLARSRDA